MKFILIKKAWKLWPRKKLLNNNIAKIAKLISEQISLWSKRIFKIRTYSHHSMLRPGKNCLQGQKSEISIIDMFLIHNWWIQLIINFDRNFLILIIGIEENIIFIDIFICNEQMFILTIRVLCHFNYIIWCQIRSHWNRRFPC